MNKNLVWIIGHSDVLLRKIYSWHNSYEKGKIYATREVEDMISHDVSLHVTIRIHKIAFKKSELLFLRDLFTQVDEDSILAKFFGNLFRDFKGKGLQSGSSKVLEIALRKEEILAIIKVMENFGNGRELLDGLALEKKKPTHDEAQEEQAKEAEGYGIFYEEF